ncbi:MAG: hypothetical protein J6Y03_00770 [Alphaproteobacteria bacterium]|nr:hypothetical protein [Alphaproteobacteria bacterium]
MQQIKSQFGRTMMEMLAVLAIIAVVTVSAIAGLDQAMSKFRISKTHDDILSINQGIVELYAWKRRYPATDIAEMCRNNVFPDGCLGVNNDMPRNIYGGDYMVETDAINQTITIRLNGLPSDACRALSSDDMDWGEYLVEGDNNPSCSSNGSVFEIVFY